MKTTMKIRIHRLNQLLNRPISVIITLILLFAYFAYGNIQFQKQNREIIERTNTSASNSEIIVGQLKKVLCEKIPQKDCNLSQAVAQLKANNDEQTVLLCKLFLTGNMQLPEADADQVSAICKQRIETLSATSASGGTSSSAKPASQGASPSSSPKASPSPNSAPQNGNGQTNNPQPKLLDCKVDLLGVHLGCP